MSIPANISEELSNLQAQLAAATPLTSASFSTIKAIQLNIDNLRADIDTALTTTALIPNIVLTTDSVLLDTWTPPSDPIGMVAGFNNVVVSAGNQSNLSLIRGLVGRVEHNTDELV